MKFLKNVHNFRAFAIIGVLGAHSLHNFEWPENSLVFISLDTLFNQSTIWFAFIAGFLFQHLSSNYSTTTYYRKKIVNVITPYLICSIPALVSSLTWYSQDVPPGFDNLAIYEKVFVFLVTGKHLAPYWYIPTITLIFLLAPLLIYIDRRPYLYVTIIPSIIISGILGRDGFLEFANLTSYYSSVAKALYLLAPYMLGMLASKYYNVTKNFVDKNFIILLLLSVLFYFLEIIYYHQTTYYIFIFKMVSSLLILNMLDVNFKFLQKHINDIADFSFSFFFIHGYFLASFKILLIDILHFNSLPNGNIFIYLIFLLLNILLCLYTSAFIKSKLGKKSRYIIGC